MSKFMKIALVASAILAISFTIGCSALKSTGKKWCIIEVKSGNINTKNCFKIGPTIYKNELMCLATDNSKVVDPPARSECTIYDNGK